VTKIHHTHPATPTDLLMQNITPFPTQFAEVKEMQEQDNMTAVINVWTKLMSMEFALRDQMNEGRNQTEIKLQTQRKIISTGADLGVFYGRH